MTFMDKQTRNPRSRFRLFATSLILCLVGVAVFFWHAHSRRASESQETSAKELTSRVGATNQSFKAAASRPLTLPVQPPVLTRTQVSTNAATVARHDADYWVKLAEEKCLPNFAYKVTVSTQTTTNGPAPSPVVPDQKPVSMTFSGDKGLHLDASTGNASFSVDIASMLRKMHDKVLWSIEREEILDGQPTICVSSTTQRLSIKLWIRSNDGAVLQFEQSLDGKQMASSKLAYTSISGTLLPEKATTFFSATGRTVTQDYTSYVVMNSQK
jgi:hypothetical protein